MTTYLFITPSALQRALLEDRSYSGLNSNAYQFPKWHVGAWKTDGSVTLADATNPSFQKIVGLSNDNIPSGQRGLFVQSGTVPGAIAGLGAAAGDAIYLSVVAGELTRILPTGDGVTAIKIGVAERSETSGLITDLRIELAGGGSSGGGDGVTLEEVQQAIAASKIQSYFNDELTTTPAYRAVAWGDDQKVLNGNALDADLADVIGVTVSSIPSHVYGPIQTEGIIQGAALSLSAEAGQPVFLAEGPGGNLTLTAPAAESSAITRIGYAVPRTGTQGAAIDLLLDIQRLFIP